MRFLVAEKWSGLELVWGRHMPRSPWVPKTPFAFVLLQLAGREGRGQSSL